MWYHVLLLYTVSNELCSYAAGCVLVLVLLLCLHFGVAISSLYFVLVVNSTSFVRGWYNWIVCCCFQLTIALYSKCAVFAVCGYSKGAAYTFSFAEIWDLFLLVCWGLDVVVLLLCCCTDFCVAGLSTWCCSFCALLTGSVSGWFVA